MSEAPPHLPTADDGFARARRARWAVTAAFATNGALLGALIPHYPEAKAAFGLDPAAFGLLVIALAVGICDGQGLGDNSKASVITRGLAETTRLAVALGGDPATMAGLAGLGDLVATCASPLSRNRTAGRHIGTLSLIHI